MAATGVAVMLHDATQMICRLCDINTEHGFVQDLRLDLPLFEGPNRYDFPTLEVNDQYGRPTDHLINLIALVASPAPLMQTPVLWIRQRLTLEEVAYQLLDAASRFW
jgi:hypothetical protein